MLVNKEIARKLLDIGFREPTDWFYYKEGPVRPLFDRVDDSDMDSLCTLAPDKSDVFAWFRKKYLYHCIDLFADGCVNYLTACVYDYRGDYAVQIFLKSDSSHSPQAFPMDYEKLEDICILKMIELHG